MKIKTDFVTNSSSASYVIAVKKDFSVKDIENELLKNKENLRNYLVEYSPYWKEYGYEDAYDNNIGELMAQETEEEQIEFLAHILAQNIYLDSSSESVMVICDFAIFSRDGSSEDIDLFSNWLYSFGNLESENLKIQVTDN